MPGVHAADLHEYYASLGHNPANALNMNLNMSNNYTQFGEVVVGGHGEFWQDAEQTEAGFKYIGTVPAILMNSSAPNTWVENASQLMKVYETYYFME
jgi:hypothetical protein